MSSTSYAGSAMRRSGFSLIEVVFAISFLIMVGVAMTVLNAAAARLIALSEIRMTALGLNEQAKSFVALEKRLNGLNARFPQHTDPNSEYYVLCDADEVSQGCTVSPDRQSQFIGRARINYTTRVSFVQIAGTTQYIVRATTAWGGGGARQIVTGQVLE